MRMHGLKFGGAVLALGMLLALGACHRGGTAAAAVPWKIALTTTPATPTVPGDTAFRVLVTDSQGQPVVGAQVTLDLVMDTMDMGPNHTAMQAQAGGVYTGSSSFAMAGPWHATVTVSAGGHTQTQTFPFTVG